jgi:hypothetical protein
MAQRFFAPRVSPFFVYLQGIFLWGTWNLLALFSFNFFFSYYYCNLNLTFHLLFLSFPLSCSYSFIYSQFFSFIILFWTKGWWIVWTLDPVILKNVRTCVWKGSIPSQNWPCQNWPCQNSSRTGRWDSAVMGETCDWGTSTHTGHSGRVATESGARLSKNIVLILCTCALSPIKWEISSSFLFSTYACFQAACGSLALTCTFSFRK